MEGISFDLEGKKKKKKTAVSNSSGVAVEREEDSAGQTGIVDESAAVTESISGESFNLSLMSKKKKKKKTTTSALIEGAGTGTGNGSETSSLLEADSLTEDGAVIAPISMLSKAASGTSLDDGPSASGGDDDSYNLNDANNNGTADDAALRRRVVRTGDSLFNNGNDTNSDMNEASSNGGVGTGRNTNGTLMSPSSSSTTAQINQQTYEKMLDRVYAILRDKNPELVGGRRRWAPIGAAIVREGSKKTAFINFDAVCKHLNRSREHFLAFLLSELATQASIDGNDYLIIRGKFQAKQVNSVIKKYCADYVLCQNCKSHETQMKRENRLTFLTCSSCGASKSVQTIRTGFQAQTGRRKN